jgi:hypothetical protein
MSTGTTAVPPAELLARFIFYHRYIRQSDQTPRPEAFMPHPGRELSVVRHDALTEEGIWDAGRAVGAGQPPLLGRADVSAETFVSNGLSVVTAPTPAVPLHVNVSGWPKEKPSQKAIALRVVVAAGKVRLAPPV